MKKNILTIALALAGLAVLSSCHHNTLEDRAEKDASEYTRRYCPTPFTDNQRTDSITFTRADKTFHYYYTLRHALQADLDKGTQNKAYKDAGFRFHYVFRSATTGKTLLEQKLKGKK